MKHLLSIISCWAFFLCLDNMSPGMAIQYTDDMFLFGLNKNNNKKQASGTQNRQYLSDVIHKLETSSLILNAQADEMSATVDEDDELDQDNYRDQYDADDNDNNSSNNDDDVDSASSIRGVKSWMCRPVYRRLRPYRQSARFSEHCQPLSDYQLVECMGYCHSQSMLWKNKDELTTAACCSMSHVSQRVTRVYCTRPIEPDEIRVDAQLRYMFKDDQDTIDMFKNSFSRSAWTSEFTSSSSSNSNLKYTGFYSIVVYYNATCGCELFV